MDERPTVEDQVSSREMLAHWWIKKYVIVDALERALVKIGGDDCYFKCEGNNTKLQETRKIKET